jgi:hypothetical protein
VVSKRKPLPRTRPPVIGSGGGGTPGQRPAPDNTAQHGEPSDGLRLVPAEVLVEILVRLDAEAEMITHLGEAARDTGPYRELPGPLIAAVPSVALAIGNPARRSLRALLAGDETEIGADR